LIHFYKRDMTTSDERRGTEKEGKKEKKKNTFYSKIVIRRLPWSMTEEEFRNCVDPLPEHDYLRFVKADYSFEKDAATRVYINFTNQEDIFIFKERFDGYVFVDAKGNEHSAVVEFAPNQKVPAAARDNRRKDLKLNTIDQDLEYIKFLELLEGPQESGMPTVEQVLEEIESKEREIKAGRGLDKQQTPLLQFMKDKKDEKVKKREDVRESRRRRDDDRKKRHDEERQRRRELKEKEIRDRERRDKDKDKDEKEKDKDHKERDKEYKEKDYKEKEYKEKEYKGKDYKEKDYKEKDYKEKEYKEKEYKGKEYKNKEYKDKEYKDKDKEYKEKSETGRRDKREETKDGISEDKERKFRDKRELEREKKREREEREKERFRKREEERQKKDVTRNGKDSSKNESKKLTILPRQRKLLLLWKKMSHQQSQRSRRPNLSDIPTGGRRNDSKKNGRNLKN